MFKGEISKSSITKVGLAPTSYSYSSSSIPKFDVFLNFSAKDTNKTFVSHLYRSLSEKSISTYYKENGASSFGSDLRRCITESKVVVVVVVSQIYPISSWCLNELQTILNLHDEGHLSVVPIFYGVDPSHVRKQTGEIAESFRKLGEEYPAEKVQAWRIALTKLTNISSLDSRFWSKEANMVDLITNEILLLLSDKPENPSAIKADGHVALDRHMQALYKLLDLKSNKEVRLVGIWGQGGVGKTTLARYAYEELSTKFHVHMFVDNTETIYHQELHASGSQEKLKSKSIEMEAHTATRSSNLKYNSIKSMLGHRKGLLVIDCVENVNHLKDIANIVDWFGSGSRIILITQEKSLLVEFGVNHMYEVQSLRYDEALELFSQSAFNQQHPPTSFESLSLRAVQIASFLPLTLKILGLSLQGKNENNWEEELHKLEGDQEKTINEVIDKSYTRASEEYVNRSRRFTYLMSYFPSKPLVFSTSHYLLYFELIFLSFYFS